MRRLTLVVLALLLWVQPAAAQREVWSNNAKSTLASGIAAGDTTLTVATGEGARFPTITGASGDWFYATLEDANPPTVREIVKVTARSGDTFTIVRAQQSTSAAAFSTGAIVEHRLTRSTLEGLQNVSTVNLAMTGETKKRFTITDANVGVFSRIIFSIRRPSSVAVDDTGYVYDCNIVSLTAGSFDVLCRVEDPDADLQPPSESPILTYIVR
jgi:hypothetical protein